jgi:hypothetical protein
VKQIVRCRTKYRPQRNMVRDTISSKQVRTIPGGTRTCFDLLLGTLHRQGCGGAAVEATY